MFKIRHFYELEVDAEAHRVLRHYIEDGLKGQNIVYRTPIYAKDYGGALNARISGVAALQPVSLDLLTSKFIPHILEGVKDFPEITKFEESFLKYTHSSRSIILPGAERLPKLLQSFELAAKKPTAIDKLGMSVFNLISDRAADALEKYVRHYIAKASIQPLTFLSIFKNMKKGTEGGLPFMQHGSVTFLDKKTHVQVTDDSGAKRYLQLAQALAKKLSNLHVAQFVAHPGQQIVSEYYRGIRSVPLSGRSYIAYNRTQEGGSVNGKEEVKNRIVGGDPHAATILGSYAGSYSFAAIRIPSRTVLKGIDYLNDQLKEMVRKNGDLIFLSADQSAFDNHILPEYFVKYIVPIIDRSINGTGSRMEREYGLGYMICHMGLDPIVTPSGVYQGVHGMPSGCRGVNEGDSLYLMGTVEWFNEYIKYKYNITEKTFSTVAVQGDDLVMLVNPNALKVMGVPYNSEGIAVLYERLCELLNLEANAKKQGVSNSSLTFCRRLGTRECDDGYRSKIGSLMAEVNMERGKDGRMPMYEARAGFILCNHYLSDPGISDFFGQISLGYHDCLGLYDKNGYYTIIQQAGGVDAVSKRLELASYTNNLGTTGAQGVDAGKLDVAKLNIMVGQKEHRTETPPKSWLAVGSRK